MGARTWLLRRALGRFRITDDVVKYLTTFQRLGENVEVELPTELLPVGARTVFRAVRTRGAAQLGVGWVWPWWLDRQLDPRSPSFVPRGHLPVLTNVTHRNWTAIGTVASPFKAVVDPRGLVTPWFDGWSLDWWVGAEDRWYVPSRETAVRQSLVEGTPVVETAMRVPGGDIAHRVYAIPGDSGGDPVAVVEVENRTPTPVAVAFAVRPYNPEGLAVVERIGLHDRTVTVDGRPALLLPRAPQRVAGSTFHDGDSAEAVFSGRAGTGLPDVRCEAGLAQAAFLFPVAHRTAVRVAMPLVAEHRTRRRGLARRRLARAPDLPAAPPSAATVAKAWRAQTARGMHLDLPPGRLADAVDANRRFLLLFHEGADAVPGPFTYHRFWFRDAAYILAALDRFGFSAESAEVLRSFPARQHVDGFYFSQRQEWDANGAALWAAAEHWRLTGETVIEAASVARAVRWIERKRQSKRRRKDPELKGLMPASVSAEHLGPFDYFYWDDFWSLRGLRDGALLLDLAGEPAAAAGARAAAEGLARDLDRSIATVAERLATLAIPAGPRRRIDPAIIGSLVACEPLRLLAPDDPRIAATADALRDRFCVGPAFYQAISHTGFGTYLTLQLASVELAAGDRRALDRLAWLVEQATDTFTWPEAIHPHVGGGCIGDGHHGWAAADFCSFVRNLLVREVGEVAAPGGTSPRPPDAAAASPSRSASAECPAPGLALCSMLPGEWLGQPIEVHDAPTHGGRLSFGVRWHGARPAVLWELQPHPWVTGPVTLTAPGLDPSWSSTERRGEALLAPVELPVRAGESFR